MTIVNVCINQDLTNTQITTIKDKIPASEFLKLQELAGKILKVSEVKKEEKVQTLPSYSINKSGNFGELKVGKTTRSQVREYFKIHDENLIIREKINNFAALYMYRDLNLAICFDEFDFSRQITVSGNYPGSTEEGVKLGDSRQLLTSIYGNPEKTEIQGKYELLSWGKFTAFVLDDKVTHFRYTI